MIDKLTDMLAEWRHKVVAFDAVAFGTLIGLVFGALTMTDSLDIVSTFTANLSAGESNAYLILLVLLGSVGYIHFSIRRFVAKRIIKKLEAEIDNDHDLLKQYTQAFNKSTAGHRPMLFKQPAGWNEVSQQTIDEIINEANDYIQELNDQFTNPSGNGKNTPV